jgi:hypothetical protein
LVLESPKATLQHASGIQRERISGNSKLKKIEWSNRAATAAAPSLLFASTTAVEVCASHLSWASLYSAFIALYKAILAGERGRKRESERFLRTGPGRKKRTRSPRPAPLGFIK